MTDRTSNQRAADVPQEVLLGKTLRQRAHQLRIEACSAWSDVVQQPIPGLDTAKCDYARAIEERLRTVIDELADLSSPIETTEAPADKASVTLSAEEFLALNSKVQSLTEQLSDADAINSASVNIRCDLEAANRILVARVERLRNRINRAYDVLAAASSDDAMEHATERGAVKTKADYGSHCHLHPGAMFVPSDGCPTCAVGGAPYVLDKDRNAISETRSRNQAGAEPSDSVRDAPVASGSLPNTLAAKTEGRRS